MECPAGQRRKHRQPAKSLPPVVVPRGRVVDTARARPRPPGPVVP